MKTWLFKIFAGLILAILVISIYWYLNSKIADPDFHQLVNSTLRQRVEKDSSIVKRNPDILVSKFTFNNVVFFDKSGSTAKLHSIDFIQQGRNKYEEILLELPNGELDIIYKKDDLKKEINYSGSDYNVSIYNGNIKIVEKYGGNKIVFIGVQE
ncbi:hypothetical protein OO013_19270 [Mangrovivirga sp. M17]|uniref:Uncharacterized protein n=1 Tax=Mangrovivirga halotolerans TaxID=2993936 RepID=A0ABT3RW70_9BACT|nr:hypothetical protein [Mangrovivirga halotolerans]MCX2746029.1 hypothetical protein [Mangrovivirga halotolerans]